MRLLPKPKSPQYIDIESPEWQEFRRDKPSAIAFLLVILAWALIAAEIGLAAREPNTVSPHQNPIFWVFGIPLIIWVGGAQSYKPWGIRILLVLMAVQGPIALALLAIAYITKTDVPYFCVSSIGAAFSCGLAYWFYRRSALRRLWPFRLLPRA